VQRAWGDLRKPRLSGAGKSPRKTAIIIFLSTVEEEMIPSERHIEGLHHPFPGGYLCLSLQRDPHAEVWRLLVSDSRNGGAELIGDPPQLREVFNLQCGANPIRPGDLLGLGFKVI